MFCGIDLNESNVELRGQWFVTNPCKDIGICAVFCYKGEGGGLKS
jgi:hypothetical protein